MKKLIVSTDVPNEIHMTRTFDAPRRLVIQAMTKPELIKRWLGGKRSTVESVAVDLRVGGRYRYEFGLPNGGGFAFFGEYREISDDRIVYTQTMDGQPGQIIVTATFDEHDGKTTMKVVLTCESQMVRDMIVATGMADGAGESYDELEKLVQSL
jgi:uncharacterized protein YndB with AHSA1/START domain